MSDGQCGNRRRRWAVAVVLLVACSMSFTQSTTTTALGPVIAITPNEVVADGFVGWVFNPSVSGRGETATVYDHEVRENGFVFLDRPGPEPMVDGFGITVSGNGCVALWARPTNTTRATSTAIGITDRCRGLERELARTNVNYNPKNRLALSFDGRFALVQFPPSFGSEFEPSHLIRIDTETLQQLELTLPSNLYDPDATFGLDISDDGSIATASIRDFTADGPPPTHFVRVWDIAAETTLSLGRFEQGSIFQNSVFPTLSGDGRFLSFVSDTSLRGAQVVDGRFGPWVYVLDRITGATRLASAAGESSYYTSLSRDASQIAFAVAAPCTGFDLGASLDELEKQCPTRRIDVAYGAAPGLGSGVATETVSTDVNGAVVGFHTDPMISGNGRWVVWISTAGNALLGSTDPALANRHEFIRRRDPGLTADAVDFGSIGPGGVLIRPSTVRNTGRTSISVDLVSAGPAAGFAVVAGGSCVAGVVLTPGSSCTVNVQFTAPSTGDAVGTLNITEAGYDPVSASAGLAGRTVAVVTTTSPTTSSTTTTTSTTTTIATSVGFTASPSPVDFGQVAVGVGSPVQTVTVTNNGNAAGKVLTELGGANPDDFYVSRNGCNDAVLAPGESCTLDIILVAQAGGDRSASLAISSNGVGGDVTLLGQGRFSPRLIASPAAVTQRETTTIIGQGFPFGGTVELRVGPTLVVAVTADAAGAFRLPLAPSTTLGLGNYVLQVDGQETVFDVVRGQLVVVLGTFEPQGPGGPAFGTSILVSRG